MVATVIRIPDEEYEFYKEYASENNWSLAEFFRKSARKMTGTEKTKKKKYSVWNLGTKVKFNSGLKDASVNTDKYYYEFEEKKSK